MVSAHDLPWPFAGKCHALLCRNYIKERDWYDYSWYLSRGGQINRQILEAALNQQGPWRGKNINIDKDWPKAALAKKLNHSTGTK